MNQIVKARVVESDEIATHAIEPREQVNIRPATMNDVAFIDRLQKKQTREVGFLQTKAIEGKIRLEQVLIAEMSGQWPVASGQKE